MLLGVPDIYRALVLTTWGSHVNSYSSRKVGTMIYEVVHYHLEHVSVQEFLDLIFNIFLTISQYALEFLRGDGQ